MRRLSVFPVRGATPAAVDPGAAIPADAAYFTFDPLHREIPLFAAASATPITRAAFAHSPGQFFGRDVTVRKFGIPLAAAAQPQPSLSPIATPFTFGESTGPIALDAQAGMRLINAREFRLGAAHFVITAQWQRPGVAGANLGAVSSLLAARADPQAFQAGPGATGSGRLVMTVVAGRPGLGWTLPVSPAARFPGAIIAMRAARAGAPHVNDARYVYLPPAFVSPVTALSYYVADDGSTFSDPGFSPTSLARTSEGQVYPALTPRQNLAPARAVQLVSRMPAALQLADNGRVAGIPLLIQAELFTGVFQPQGAIVTVDQPAGNFPDLQPLGNPWLAFTYAPARNAPPETVPAALLGILLRPLSGNFVPSCELIVRGRGGDSLLVYLPEIAQCPATGVRLFVAEDGSTWTVPVNPQPGGSLAAGQLARAAYDQALPLAGTWPLQYRQPVLIDLCRSERRTLLHPGELGIDPEIGRFALAPEDPAIAGGGFSVDYVEAFPDRVGALTYDRMLNPAQPARRFVSQFGEAAPSVSATPQPALPVHTTLAAAVAAAAEGDVIEILDSVTYGANAAITFARPELKTLTIRAAAGTAAVSDLLYRGDHAGCGQLSCDRRDELA